MPTTHPNVRHDRYALLQTAPEIDGELARLSRILHMTESLQMRDIIREDQDFLLDLRNRRLHKGRRGTRVPTPGY